MSGRPLASSKAIAEELKTMNDRFEAKTQMILARLPEPRQQISDEEKATLIKLGLPIPDQAPSDDLVLQEVENLVELTRSSSVEIVQGRVDVRQIQSQLTSVASTVTSISWGMAVLFAIVIVIWLSSIKGCDVTPIPEPTPNPPIPAPGPEPIPVPRPPHPSPTPSPTPAPPNVIQLDNTEMQIYQFAIANVKGDNEAEKRASLNFLLGNISQKSDILAVWPNEKVTLLP